MLLFRQCQRGSDVILAPARGGEGATASAEGQRGRGAEGQRGRGAEGQRSVFPSAPLLLCSSAPPHPSRGPPHFLSIPSFFIRAWRVVLFNPSRAAAPTGPPTTQLV